MNGSDVKRDEQGMGGGAMVGEIRCLMCSRCLADVVDGINGRARLVPPAGRSAAPILVERTASGLRCARCGGRAMYEPLLGGEARTLSGPMRLVPAA